MQILKLLEINLPDVRCYEVYTCNHCHCSCKSIICQFEFISVTAWLNKSLYFTSFSYVLHIKTFKSHQLQVSQTMGPGTAEPP